MTVLSSFVLFLLLWSFCVGGKSLGGLGYFILDGLSSFSDDEVSCFYA